MRKTISTVSVLLIVILIGWFFWMYLKKKPTSNPWDVVSSNAAIVIESDDYSALKSSISLPNDIAFEQVFDPKAKPYFNKKRILIAFYTGNNSIETLYILPFVNDQAFLKSINKVNTIKNRNFNGVSIGDFYVKEKHTLSYAAIDELIVVGPSFLVEGAIRTSTSLKQTLFSQQYHSLFEFTALKSDNGNVYVNFRELLKTSKSLNSFFVENFASSAITDLKLSKDQILLNGFAVDSIQENSFLSLFKQKPGSFLMKEIISDKSIFVTHYCLSNTENWFSKRDSYINQKSKDIQSELEKIKEEMGEDFNMIKQKVGNEISVSYLKDVQGNPAPLVIVKAKGSDIDQILKNRIGFSEQYSEYLIKELNNPSLAKCLLWPIAPNSDFSFYSILKDYIVFSNDRDVLKEFLSSYDTDNTINKSLEWNKFLSSTVQESSVSLFFTGNGIAEILKNEKLTNLNFLGLTKIDKAAIQFSSLDKNFYTNSIINLKGDDLVEAINIGKALNFKSQLTRSPQIVKNHIDKSSEIFLQDSLNTIHLASTSNQILWSMNDVKKIRGKVSQIDFFKNGKLQYFFSTQDRLYLVDRLGRNVRGFPKQLSLNNDEVLFLKVIDYDQTRDYRFMVGTKKGNVFLFDRDGKGLENWNPKSVKGNILDVSHYRISGNDYFLVIQSNGTLHLIHRNGDMAKKIPIQLNINVSGCFMVKDQRSNYFSVVSDDGMLINVNLEGEIIKKEPLLKNFAQSKFKLIASNETGQSFISRIDKNKIAVFSQDGKLLFEKENPASEQIEMTAFGEGKIFSVFDSTQDLLLLLDKNGKELLNQPLESTHSPAIEFIKGDKIRLNYVFRDQLFSLTL